MKRPIHQDNKLNSKFGFYFFEKIRRSWSGLSVNLVKTERIVLIVVIVLFMTSFLRVYQINLFTRINDKFSVYYNVGSVLIQKWDTINQYRTKKAQFNTDYLTSLYEPQVKIGSKMWTIYRPKPQEIKFKGENWYFYIAEMRAYLTKDPTKIPNYDNNFIVGPSLNLYGQNNTVYNYNWNEILSSYWSNKVDVEINCARFSVAKCPDKIDKLNIKIYPVNNVDTFKMEYNFNFTGNVSCLSKEPITAFVVPENFLICPTSKFDTNYCLEPQDQRWTDRDNVPVWVFLNDNKIEKITLKDLGFSDFYLTNLKISDYYNLNFMEDLPLDKASTYYLVHPSGAYLAITPSDPKATTVLQKQFGTLRFLNSVCDTSLCSTSVDIKVGKT